jgi:hypothetical protein
MTTQRDVAALTRPLCYRQRFCTTKTLRRHRHLQLLWSTLLTERPISSFSGPDHNKLYCVRLYSDPRGGVPFDANFIARPKIMLCWLPNLMRRPTAPLNPRVAFRVRKRNRSPARAVTRSEGDLIVSARHIPITKWKTERKGEAPLGEAHMRSIVTGARAIRKHLKQ